VSTSVASIARSSSLKVPSAANSSSKLKKILSSNPMGNALLKRLIASCAGISVFLNPHNLRYSSISHNFLANTVSNCHPSSRCKISALKSASLEYGGLPAYLYKRWTIFSIGVKSMTFSISEKDTLDQDRGVKLVKSWIERVFTNLSFELAPIVFKPAQSTLISLSLFCWLAKTKVECL